MCNPESPNAPAGAVEFGNAEGMNGAALGLVPTPTRWVFGLAFHPADDAELAGAKAGGDALS